jgi:hypothetical protein
MADDAAVDAADAFWAAQDAEAYWTVPVAHGASMPWLKVHERGLLVAIQRAHELGRTVLLLDNSGADRVVDTFYEYQGSLVIEAKRAVLDVAQARQSLEQVLEHFRQTLVSAMRYGQTLYVRLADSAADFSNRFNSDESLPLAIFDRAVVSALHEYREGSANNLWGADHPLARALRSDDCIQGVFQPRFAHKVREVDGGMSGFEVVVSTTLDASSFADLLGDSLPLSRFQPIKPQLSSVRVLYSHYDRQFELSVGGTLSFEAIDEQYALSFVFKGEFKARLVESTAAAAGSPPQRRDWRDRTESQPSAEFRGATAEPIEARDGVYHALRGGAVYKVVIEEDEAAEAAARGGSGGGGLSAEGLAATKLAASQAASRAKAGPAGLAGRSDDGRTQTAALLSAELQSLSALEIAERSERYKSLREASDLQDVVFGSG